MDNKEDPPLPFTLDFLPNFALCTSFYMDMLIIFVSYSLFYILISCAVSFLPN